MKKGFTHMEHGCLPQHQTDEPQQQQETEEQAALRWRRAILNLSNTLREAADQYGNLAPYLMEAMHYALDNLLVHGREDDLLALEEWLQHEQQNQPHSR